MSPSIETGHVYGVNRVYPFEIPGDVRSSNFQKPLDENFEFEMTKGLDIQKFLEEKMGGCQRIWFHDDIIPQMRKITSLDSWRWQHFMSATKNQVLDRLAYDGVIDITQQNEYDLIHEAKNISIPDIISAIEVNNDWSYNEEKRVLMGPKKGKKKQRIRLYGYREYDNIPSCEVLDYTFYVKRLKETSPTITLIHESMKGQQERVRAFFNLQGIFPDVITLFHNGESITESNYWGNDVNTESLAKDLKDI